MLRGSIIGLVGLTLLCTVAQAQGGETFQYSAKVVCGPPPAGVLAPGLYYTAINIHNPLEKAVAARWKVAVASSGDQSGPISGFFEVKLAADGAREIDCAEVVRAARVHSRFVKGFVVIESKTELDVVGVYTVAGATKLVESLDIERVPARSRAGNDAGCPDLIVETIERPTWDGTNHRSVIRATIKNVGSAPAAASLARVVDPTTPQSTGAPYNAVADTPALAPGASAAVTFYLPYWVYNPDVTLEVTADYKDTLTECDESNNRKTFSGIG